MDTSGIMTSDALEAVLRNREHDDAKVFELLRRFESDGDGQQPQLVSQLVAELRANLEERQVAEEELRATSHQLEQAYLDLLEQRRRDRELFEHAPVAYLVTDAKGMIRDRNHLAARWLHADDSRSVGLPLATFVAEDDRKSFRSWLNALARPGSVDVGGFRLVTRTGRSQPVRASVSVVRDQQDLVRSLRWVLVPADASTTVHGPAPARVRANVPLRTAIVHHDDLYVHALRAMLTTSFGTEVEVATRAEPADVDALLDHEPHALLLELTADQIPLLTRLRRDHPHLAILTLIADDPEIQLAALAAGADSVLPVTTTPNEVLGPLLSTAQQWVTMPRPLTDQVLGGALRRHQALRQLSSEQRQLLGWLSQGATTADMAERLHLSPRTVKRRLSSLYHALDVEGRAEAIALVGQLEARGVTVPDPRN